ncbi:MAG: RagB/SusD family nutrient uptake outer membrane protein [Candidatus Cyclobacteriaceae bacterium M3_2C_046]
MKLIYKLFLFVLVMVIITACSEDFLEEPPQNNLTTENFWQSQEDVESAINSIYYVMARPMAYGVGQMVFGDVYADDMGSFDANWFAALDNYQTKSTDVVINGGNTIGAWSAMYGAIFRANWVLENINKAVTVSDEIRDRSINEAKFLRGLAYFNIANIWGDAPLLTEPLTPDEAENLTRDPVSGIYQQIEKDLLAAAGLDGSESLPVKGTYELGRATKASALGLLARFYLYRENYQKAEEIAEKVINMGTYDLNWEDYGANWDNTMKNGIESLFEIQYASNQGGTWGMNPGNWVTSFTAMSGYDPGGGGWNIIVPTLEPDEVFEEGDLRRPVTIFEAGSSYEFAPEGEQEYDTTQSQSGLHLAKYIIRNHYSTPDQPNYLDSDMNNPVIRYAEILLIYAEALYKNGRSEEAFEYLNMIRERAGLSELSDNEDFMQALAQERRVELLGEGHRFFDLRRWGKLTEVLGPLGYDPETQGYFPVPQSELDLAENIFQNQGY